MSYLPCPPGVQNPHLPSHSLDSIHRVPGSKNHLSLLPSRNVSIAFVESQQISTTCLEESLMQKNEVYNCVIQVNLYMVTPQSRNSTVGHWRPFYGLCHDPGGPCRPEAGESSVWLPAISSAREKSDALGKSTGGRER